MGTRDSQRNERSARAGRRLFWAAASLAMLAVLAFSLVLDPDPSGLGTHEQLGLPPCGFLWFTGLPCPSCGLTTSFAHIARLEITAAFHAHVLGIPLFLLSAAALPLAAAACLRAWPIAETMERLAVGKLAWLLLGLAVVAWIFRLVAQLV